MKTKMLLPDKIKVGFQYRSDTYSGKLAYVTYFDHKGELKKANSWEGWRDTDIEPVEMDNLPTEGFVFNRSGGGNPSWSDRKAFCRVWHPDGWEFEISIDNMMYIMACCDIMKGKGVIGELIFAWDGQTLVLLPVESPAYTDIVEYTQFITQNEPLKAKDLKVGYTYLDKDEQEYVYLGRFFEYGSKPLERSKARKHFFAAKSSWDKSDFPYYVTTVGSLGKRFLMEHPRGVVEDFTPYQELLDSSFYYSPIKFSAPELVPLSYRDIYKRMDYLIEQDDWNPKVTFHVPKWGANHVFALKRRKVYGGDKAPYLRTAADVIGYEFYVTKAAEDYYWNDSEIWCGTLDEFEEEFSGNMQPHYTKTYLESGKVYKVSGYNPETNKEDN
ncbi:hypothetical protein JANET_227 [Bacillus phage Janet]|nr:hypothetical protein JANET_227 [Bacillus phage Janet]